MMSAQVAEDLRRLRDTDPEAFAALPAKLMADHTVSHEARWWALDCHAEIAAEAVSPAVA